MYQIINDYFSIQDMTHFNDTLTIRRYLTGFFIKMSYKISLKDTSIKSCKCYETYWKKVINSKNPLIQLFKSSDMFNSFNNN